MVESLLPTGTIALALLCVAQGGLALAPRWRLGEDVAVASIVLGSVVVLLNLVLALAWAIQPEVEGQTAAVTAVGRVAFAATLGLAGAAAICVVRAVAYTLQRQFDALG